MLVDLWWLLDFALGTAAERHGPIRLVARAIATELGALAEWLDGQNAFRGDKLHTANGRNHVHRACDSTQRTETCRVSALLYSASGLSTTHRDSVSFLQPRHRPIQGRRGF